MKGGGGGGGAYFAKLLLPGGLTEREGYSKLGAYSIIYGIIVYKLTNRCWNARRHDDVRGWIGLHTVTF